MDNLFAELQNFVVKNPNNSTVIEAKTQAEKEFSNKLNSSNDRRTNSIQHPKK